MIVNGYTLRSTRANLSRFSDWPRFGGAGFKLPTEGISSVRTIARDSTDWHDLQMGKRLVTSPVLARFVREGTASIVFTSETTSTCKEKARAAGIPVETTVKALYVKDAFSPDKRYLVVASGKGRLDLSGLVPDSPMLEMCTKEELPPGMEFGTCSPFVSPEFLAGLAMVVIESPASMLERKMKNGGFGDPEADFSIGGVDQAAHHLSGRMNYRDLVAALQYEYGAKACIVSDIRRN